MNEIKEYRLYSYRTQLPLGVWTDDINIAEMMINSLPDATNYCIETRIVLRKTEKSKEGETSSDVGEGD